MKFYLILLFVMICAVNCDNWLTNAAKGISGGACLLSITPKLTSDCLEDFNEELEDRPKDEPKSKAICCAYLRLQTCVLKIAEDKCGSEGEEVSKSFLKTINRGITSDDCIDYGFISCITLTQLAIVGAIALALMALFSCICCCCCRR